MKFDFTSIIDRHGKDALAVDSIGASVPWAEVPTSPKEGFDAIPMWVADMNFKTAPTITKAMKERLEHPLFGYFNPTDEYFDCIINWQKKRNNVTDLEKENICYENGVLGCVSSVIRTYTKKGDKILLHSPTYIGFTHVLEDTERIAELSPLKLDENGRWTMDYEDMDRRIKENNIKVCIFCSPHNPCGRVWEKEEIEKAFEVYKNNDCIVVSDEIWSDILLDGNKHIPTQSVNEDARNRTVACYALSKTFNLAGLVGSYSIIYDEKLKSEVLKTENETHYNALNVLCEHAIYGAYNEEGEAWVSELNEVLSKNMGFAYDFIKTNFKGVQVSKPEGTYMLLLDCTEYLNEKGLTINELIQKGWDVGVAWQKGDAFHVPNGIRMNLALPFSKVEEAFERLKNHVFL